MITDPKKFLTAKPDIRDWQWLEWFLRRKDWVTPTLHNIDSTDNTYETLGVLNQRIHELTSNLKVLDHAAKYADTAGKAKLVYTTRNQCKDRLEEALQLQRQYRRIIAITSEGDDNETG